MIKSILRSTFVLAFSFLLVTSFINIAQAQDFEEWKQNYLNEFKEFQNEYDKQFHEMLQKEWKEFDIEISADLYQKPKPNVVPQVESPEVPEPKTTVKLEEPKVKDKEQKKKETEKTLKKEEPGEKAESPKGELPKKKAANQEVGNRTNKENIKLATPENGLTPTFEPNVKKAKVQTNNLTFFDIPIQYKFYSAYMTQIDRPVDKKAISDFWKHLSTKDYPSFLDQAEQVRSQLSLNDYGYAQLLEQIGEQIYGQDTHEATLFTWFMLTQSGFGTRIAYNRQGVYLLIKTSPGVFRTTYFTINGSKFYGLSFSESYAQLPDKLYTYEGDYPKSKAKELNLRFAALPTLPQKQEMRTLSFSYKDTSYTFEVPVDQQIVNYFKNYPKANLDLYFNSRMQGATHDKLISSLEPLLDNKSDIEKVNILLRFVQRSFEYQTDQEQFNEEKKMFPMEALYYPANDCDDRTILFGYLLEHLTDLDYVVLRYPGHLTPAVHFSSNPPSGSQVGNPITYNGKSYYVSDPTYFGADAGMIMPDYENTRPEEIFDL